MPNSSYRGDPWTTFSRQSDIIFTQNFLPQAHFTFKTAHRPSRGIIKFKEVLKGTESAQNFSEQIKIWVPVSNQGATFFSRYRQNQIKGLYENGVRSYAGSLVNFYGGLQYHSRNSETILKLGADLIGVNTNLDSRLRVVYGRDGSAQISSAHKWNWVTGNWVFDLCQVFNYHNLSVYSSSARAIYSRGENQYFVKAQNRTDRRFTTLRLLNPDTYFTNFTLDYVRRIGHSVKTGLRVQFTKDSLQEVCLVGQKTLSDGVTSLKAKISSNKLVSLSYQTALRNYGRAVLGWELAQANGKTKSRVGLMIDLNL